MSLALYHSPFACSLASRFALAEADIPHEIVVVNLGGGAQHEAEYLSVNPRAKVPALATAHGVLTESTAILPYIADLVPEKRLFPEAGTFARAEGQSWLSFMSSSVHAAFTGVIRPERFTTNPQSTESTRAAFVERVATAFAPIEAHLAGQDYMLDEFGVCDVYLLVFLTWRGSPVIAGKLPPFAALDEFQQRLLARPALAAAMGGDMQLMAEQSPYSKAP